MTTMRPLAQYRFHRIALAIGIWGVSVLIAPSAGAQTLTLTVSPSTITFAAADPDTTPSIAASSITVSYRVRNNAAGSWRISLLASGDLTAGSATIPITNVTWTASPTPRFQAGTLSRTLAQTLASGSGNVQNTTTGTVVFRLANSWTYNVGSYSTSVVFTLTAP
jgi:hypothetical protein